MTKREADALRELIAAARNVVKHSRAHTYEERLDKAISAYDAARMNDQ